MAYQNKVLLFGLSLAACTFTRCIACSSLPFATDGNWHLQLPRRLAPSGPVRGSFNIAQDLPPQPLMLPGAQGQLCQEHTVTQLTSIVPGHSYRADDSNCLSGASHDDSVPCGFLQGRDRPSAQSFPENSGPMAAASPVLQLSLHTGERPSSVGSDQGKGTSQGTTSPQRNGRSTRSWFRKSGKIWQSSSRSLCLRRQLLLPNLFNKEHECPGPRVTQFSTLCFHLQLLCCSAQSVM